MQSNRFNRSNSARGFSLVELLAVIMLLGIIAGIVVPKVFGQAEKGKWQASKTKVSSVSAKVESYALDVGRPPEQLQDLIERLLCLTEQPAAAGEVVAEPVELRPLVEEELAVRREASPPARLPITWQPPADEEPPAPLVASGEPRRLRRILRGLLDNALAFAREQVAVSLERTVEGEVPCLRLIVDDDGPGIPPEHRELVFTTFFQVDQAPTRRHDGLGLGLPVARKLAAEMGGRIHATASPLGGARLVLELRQAQLAVPSP